MTIRIPPPDPNDVLGPDAQMIVDQASAEMTTWIETRVGELRDKAKAKVEEIAAEVGTSISEAEQELDDLQRAEESEIEAIAGKITELVASFAPNASSGELRQQVIQELEARNQRFLSVGRGVVNKAKAAIGKLPGISILS